MHSLYAVLAIGNTVMMCMFAAAYAVKAEAGRQTAPCEAQTRGERRR